MRADGVAEDPGPPFECQLDDFTLGQGRICFSDRAPAKRLRSSCHTSRRIAKSAKIAEASAGDSDVSDFVFDVTFRHNSHDFSRFRQIPILYLSLYIIWSVVVPSLIGI